MRTRMKMIPYKWNGAPIAVRIRLMPSGVLVGPPTAVPGDAAFRQIRVVSQKKELGSRRLSRP